MRDSNITASQCYWPCILHISIVIRLFICVVRLDFQPVTKIHLLVTRIHLYYFNNDVQDRGWSDQISPSNMVPVMRNHVKITSICLSISLITWEEVYWCLVIHKTRNAFKCNSKAFNKWLWRKSIFIYFAGRRSAHSVDSRLWSQ